MGRGTFNPDDIVRVGLNTLTLKLTLPERLEKLFAERRSELGLELTGANLNTGVSPGMFKAYLDGTFPHERAAREIGRQLDLDWATLTLARFLPGYPQQVKADMSFPRDPGLEFQFGLAMRTLGARSSEHAKRVEFLSEWVRIGLPAEAVEESLDWFVDHELERAERGQSVTPDSGYFSAAEKMRWQLRDCAVAEDIPLQRDTLADHFAISHRQASLIFFGQERDLRTPSWEAVEKVAKFLRLPEARVWLVLASEALPYSQRVRRKGTKTLHGELEENFQRATGLLTSELPHSDPARDTQLAEQITLQVRDDLQIRFEKIDWERPYHDILLGLDT